ncbi:MAG: hypothetical protein R3A46_06515 [Thermomicrobiales bacterium]
MAGNHQLWMMDPGGAEIRRFAGTGHEGKRDDLVPRAWLAQPSGIGRYQDRLIFADAETSSIRTSATSPEGEVSTLVGKDLFDWGDLDGTFEEALLQHATGVVADPETGLIYVSDTYNNKIKVIDPAEGRISGARRTWRSRHADGPAEIAAGVLRTARSRIFPNDRLYAPPTRTITPSARIEILHPAAYRRYRYGSSRIDWPWDSDGKARPPIPLVR